MNNLFVEETGSPEQPAIVFLHGGGGAGWMWQPQVEALRNDYHLLVPDMPAHGRSAAVKPFSHRDTAERVAELIRQRSPGQKAHVVGLSEGAQVTLMLLSLAPETVDHAVVSSALVHPMPGTGWLTAGLMASSLRLCAPLNRYDWWIRLNMQSNGIPLEYFRQDRQLVTTLDADSFGHIVVEGLRFRLPAGLERVTVPTLVVGGKKEYPAMQQSIRDAARALPAAQGFLVAHPRRMTLAQEHNWSMTAPQLFTRTLRAWIEGGPLPEELKPV